MADENEPMIQTPAEFGHFLLEKELGHGGMGGVYLGRDRMLDRPVGIKVMLKSLGDDPTFVERFQREAQAAARLNHPNIAQIYSFGTEQGMPYIAMELCTGGSFDKEMEQNPGSMDIVKVMRLGRQLAEALALAAEQGLVHGDVKPENVLYDNEGNAKLVDFGLAAMQGDSDEIWGTPYYISPEKVRRQQIDYRADIYSLGGTLYHALTGQPPFEGVDATAVVKARFEAPPPKPSEIRPEIPPEVDAIIMRMLELEPAMRYPTYGSLLGDIRRYLDKAGPEKSATVTSRVRLKGRKAKLTAPVAAEGLPPVAAEAGTAAGEAEEKHMSLGLIVALVAAGIVLLLGGVAGGLFWYVHSEKAAAIEAEQQAVRNTRAKALAAIETTKQAVADFGTNFSELVAKTRKGLDETTLQLKGKLSAEMLAAIGGEIRPPENASKDIADAKAYVAECVAKDARAEAEAAAQAAAKAEQAAQAAAAEAAASTNASAAAASTNAPAAAAENATTNAPAAKPAEPAKDAKAAKPAAPAKDAKAAPAKAAKPAAPAKDAKAAKPAAPVEEEKPAAAAKPPVELPMDLKNFVAIWGDMYFCQAAEIRVQGRVALLLKQIDRELGRLTAVDAETVKQLAEYSTKVVDELGSIKAMKCVEQTLKKVGVIKSKSENLVKTIERQAAKIKAKAEKAAKELAAKEAAAAKAAAQAEAHKAAAAAEIKQVADKWESLSLSLLRHLSWGLCRRQLDMAGSEFTTQEGRDEIKMFKKRVDMYESFQKQLIAKGKGVVYLQQRGALKTEITASSAKDGLAWTQYRKVKGKYVKAKTGKASWAKFYQRPEHRPMMKRLIMQLVVKGQEDSRTRLGPMKWADNMLGAALTMHTFMADDPELNYADKIVQEAVKGFEPCRKYAAKFFPDVDIGAAPVSEEF